MLEYLGQRVPVMVAEVHRLDVDGMEAPLAAVYIIHRG